MNINLTLIVQIFHFFVAYWLLRLFLFKPLLAIIKEEDHIKEQLEQSLAQKKNKIARIIAEQEEQWRSYEHQFKQRKPIFAQQYEEIKVPEIKEIEGPTKHEIEQHVQELAEYLEKKVDHVS